MKRVLNAFFLILISFLWKFVCLLFSFLRRLPSFRIDIGVVASFLIDASSFVFTFLGLVLGDVNFRFPASCLSDELRAFTMSVPQLFTVVGDSNVRRNMTPFNVRDRPGLVDAQVLACSRLEVLPDALRSVRASSTIVILACLTNYLTSSEESSTTSDRVYSVLSEFRQHIDAFCVSRPSTVVIVSPPMFRTLPHWYSVGLPEILIQFSALMSADRPQNLHLIGSFSSPELMPDGVHLTPYSGLHYIVHLFDASRIISEAPVQPPELAKTTEDVRSVTDRVVVLEQSHARLAAAHSLKVAIDSEMDDFLENTRFEDHFLISGLSVEAGLGNREWQNRVKDLIQEKIKLLLGRSAPIAYVQNATGGRKDGIKTYLVRMVQLEDSKIIRDKFGSFFKAGARARPPGLIGLSIRNRVTIGTRIRLEIMKLLAERYRVSNPGSKTQVINYDSRPTMKFTPPSTASDRRILHFTYIKAITKLPVNFTEEELAPIYKVANTSSELYGRLREVFVVLQDEVARAIAHRNTTSASGSAPSGPVNPVAPAVPQPSGSRGGRSSRSSRSSSHRMEHDRSRSRSPLGALNPA